METIKVKAVFFDIDGTTYEHYNHNISNSTKKALNELKKNGYKVCFVTGRNIAEMKHLPPFFSTFKYDALVSDGGSITRIDNKIVQAYPIPEQIIEKVMNYCNDSNITLRYTTSTNTYFVKGAMQYVKDLFFKLYLFTPKIKEYNNEKVYNLLTYTTNQNQKDDIAKLIDGSSHLDLQDCLEILHIKAGKHLAILELVKAWGININECMAFGDGYNDIPMLKTVGYGIAVGNANEELKKSAWKVCDNINDDGIYKILKVYNLI